MELVLELLASGWSVSEVLENYPHLVREDILAALSYAHELLKTERIYPFVA